MTGKVLIVDDEKDIRDSFKTFFSEEGFQTYICSDGEEAYDLILNENFDVVITDINMPKIDGIELMRKTSEAAPETFFLLMTAYASVKTAIDALRKGAYDYIVKPVELEELLLRIKRLISYKRLSLENKYLRQRMSSEPGFQNIIGESEPMKKVFEIISRVSTTSSNVLIMGKSGTGKELVAKAIHFNGNRKDSIFLPVNCGAISENLIESELFGHKKGAFTGATDEKMGLFKVADGGTIFLDEIGELPLNMQVKLLRVLEDKQFLPVGGTKPISTDVRIIAATNQNLYEKTKTGEFREDLFYRLNVVEIKLPSLNERREDIPLLVNHFIDKYRSQMNRKIIGVDNDTMRVLMIHDWRGGVRELENVIERAIIFARDELISTVDLSDYLQGVKFSESFPDSLKDAMRVFERDHIIKTIKRCNYDKDEAAKALQIGLSSLYRKMEELDIPTKAPKEE